MLLLVLLSSLPLVVPSPSCQDDPAYASKCPRWTIHCSGSKWSGWMEVFCPASCTACKECQCEDNPTYSVRCAKWKSHCASSSQGSRQFVHQRCPSTCNQCACCADRVDKNSNCEAWTESGYCETGPYVAWMFNNCYKSCTCDKKIQKEETTTTTTTPSTSTTTSTTTTTSTSTTTTPQNTSTTSTYTTDANTCNLQCGLKNSGKRVVGGANTEVNEYPWMVALYKRGRTLPSCGGTLINSKWIVTAGHCHDSSFPLDVAVLGEHDVTVETETMIKIERNIVYKLRHESYNTNTLKNDIALFKMDAAVDTSVYLPACLPPAGADYVGKTAWVTGWGTTSENGNQATILQELELKIVDDKTCYDAMTGALGTFWGETFADEQVCAGGEAGKDGCQGDSGGPFVHDRDGVFELIGAVSWGLGCARPGVYGIYTEVEHYLPWIASSIANNDNEEVTVDSIICV